MRRIAAHYLVRADSNSCSSRSTSYSYLIAILRLCKMHLSYACNISAWFQLCPSEATPMLDKTLNLLELCLNSPHLPQILMAAVCLVALAVVRTALKR